MGHARVDQGKGGGGVGGGVIARLAERFAAIPPTRRRNAAVWMLLVSFALGHLNIGLFLVGVILIEPNLK